MSNTTKNILIGSCGGLTGCYLTRELNKIGYRVIGFDSCEINVTKKFLDKFFCVPEFNSPLFLDHLINILNEEKIYAYFPTHSDEIRFISKNEFVIKKKWNGNFLVPPYKTFLKLDSKQKANLNLKDIGIPVPRMYKEINEIIDFPVIVKPNIGSGSKNTIIINNPQLLSAYVNSICNTSIFQYIKGREYTVDCMFDNNGKLIEFNQRVRLKSIGGAVVITQNDYSFDIKPYLKIIEKNFIIKGCVNFQYILKDNVPYFIDINLRYPSGGLPLTINSGIDVLNILFDIFEGNTPKSIDKKNYDKKLMYRFFEEWYEY